MNSYLGERKDILLCPGCLVFFLILGLWRRLRVLLSAGSTSSLSQPPQHLFVQERNRCIREILTTLPKPSKHMDGCIFIITRKFNPELLSGDLKQYIILFFLVVFFLLAEEAPVLADVRTGSDWQARADELWLGISSS